MKRAQCNCAEVKDEHGNKLPEVIGHNCEYIRNRNQFLTDASSYAQTELDKTELKLPSERSSFFNRVFSEKMDELCVNL